MEGEIADGDTVCSFCGMSHLMYGEMRKKERRIVELEKELAKATASGGRPATAQEQTKSHYAQLDQMQASCAKRLEAVTELERKLGEAQNEITRLRVALQKSDADAKAERSAAEAAMGQRDAESKARAGEQATLTERVSSLDRQLRAARDARATAESDAAKLREQLGSAEAEAAKQVR